MGEYATNRTGLNSTGLNSHSITALITILSLHQINAYPNDYLNSIMSGRGMIYKFATSVFDTGINAIKTIAPSYMGEKLHLT